MSSFRLHSRSRADQTCGEENQCQRSTLLPHEKKQKQEHEGHDREAAQGAERLDDPVEGWGADVLKGSGDGLVPREQKRAVVDSGGDRKEQEQTDDQRNREPEAEQDARWRQRWVVVKVR